MSRPLRIVAGIRQFSPAVGGAQNLLIDVLAALRDAGHDTSVVTIDAASVPDTRGRGAGLPRRELIDGVMVHRVPPDGGANGRLLSRFARHPLGGRFVKRATGLDLPYWGDRPSVLAMSRTLATIPVDCFLSVGWFARHVPLMHAIARARSVPVIGLPCFHLAQRSAYWPRHRWLARSSAAVVTLSEPEAEHARHLGAPLVQTIPPALPAGWHDAADPMGWRTRHDLDASVPIVAFVGRQVAKKGCTHLLRAMRLVWTTHPHARLLLAGQLRNRDDATTAQLNALSPHERARVIEVHDFSDADAASIMSAATIVAMPSADEAFGIVYLEAWACSRPVIAADIPSSRWLIGDSDAAVLVQPDDDSALAIAIRQLIDTPRRTDAMGARGRAMAASRFTPQRFATMWHDLLEQVVGIRSALGGAAHRGADRPGPSSLDR